VLALLVTATQFSGKFNLQQLFALAMVEVFAFALNFSICQFGTPLSMQVFEPSLADAQPLFFSLATSLLFPSASWCAVRREKCRKRDNVTLQCR
jgi:hypothetical protein